MNVPGADLKIVSHCFEKASLYVHIPFCAGACCDYCDFFSDAVDPGAVSSGGQLDHFIESLLDDVADQFALFGVKNVPSVYIGGGTPSALGAARMERLLEGLSALLIRLDSFPDEYTVEANPESSDEEFLRVCRNSGVTRLSLGVQTFHEPSRHAVRRGGDSASLEKSLARAARYFPGAFSADLIAALPFQTEAMVRNDITRVLAFEPAHVSLYSLTISGGTPLAENVKRRGRDALFLPAPDAADSIWLAGRDALVSAGYAQYEVSSFALPGNRKRCAHNIRYWRMSGWLGAGPSASGTLIHDETGTGRRFTYPADTAEYLAAPRPKIHSALAEELDRPALMRESLLMGFRFIEGPDAALFRRRFSASIEECIPRTIERWQRRGFFSAEPSPHGIAGGTLRPSREGLLFADAFLRDAFAELG